MNTILLMIGGGVSIVLTLVFLTYLTRRIAVAPRKIEESLQARTRELEAAKAKIELERDQLSAILSAMAEGLIVFDRNRNIILMNQAAGILLRMAPGEGIGKQITDVFNFFKGEAPDAPHEERMIQRVLDQADIVAVKLADDFYCKNRAGTVFPISLMMGSLLRGRDVTGAIILFHDVSVEKAIDRAKSEFVSLASHQLRTPLATIRWYIEFLLGKARTGLTEEQESSIHEIYQATKKMIEMVNALLNVSKIELGTLEVEPEPIEAIEFTKSMIHELAPQIKERHLAVEERYEGLLPPFNADPKLLRIIIQNLLSNAIKYTPDAGRIQITVTLQGRKRDEEESGEEPKFLFTVSDAGYGIPKDQQPKVFTKLFRAENVREKEAEGTGLGLYITKAVVKKTGGSIWFESPSTLETGAEELPAKPRSSEKWRGKKWSTTFYVAFPSSGMPKKKGIKLLISQNF